MPEPYAQAHLFQKHVLRSWKSAGVYCPVCFRFSKNLGFLFDPGNRCLEPNNPCVQASIALSHLARSVQNGCQFCCFMLLRFFTDPSDTTYSHAMDRSFFCCHRDSQFSMSDQVRQTVARIQAICTKYRGAAFTVIAQPNGYSPAKAQYERIRFAVIWTNLESRTVVEEILGSRREMVIEIFAAEGRKYTAAIGEGFLTSDVPGNTAARYIEHRPTPIAPGSVENMRMVSRWVSHCIREHSQCAVSMPPPKPPTFLVRILGDERLQLRAVGVPVRYSILSYCWGGSQSSSTTLETISARMDGFRVSDLPRSVQDAVRLTSELGLMYIWIDSLCIIQDWASERARELARMPLYYKYAHVTICPGANSCESGFLQSPGECQRHPGTGIPRDLLSMPFLCPDGERGTIFFRAASPYWLSLEPVSTRAWTLQERILSPRVIVYGAQISWQCRTVEAGVGGLLDLSHDTRSSTIRKFQRRLGEAEFAAISAGRAYRTGGNTCSRYLHHLCETWYHTHRLGEHWYDMVQEFSRRHLTFPEDKLLAVAGLADEIASFTRQRYVAGLWRDDLLGGLMWSTYPILDPERPAQWRAPSWSWASVDAEITYGRRPPLSMTPVAEIVSIDVVPKSAAVPRGQLQHALLEIRAPVFRIDSDWIVEAIRKEYLVVDSCDKASGASSGNTSNGGVTGTGLLTGDTFAGAPDHDFWQLPPNSVVLILFVEKIAVKSSPSTPALTLASASVSTSDSDPAWTPTSSSHPRYHSVLNTAADGEEWECGRTYGLVLRDAGGGQYERLTCFTSLVGNWSAHTIKTHSRLIRIV